MSQIIDREIKDELSESYLTYAGYVLQNRAIPDSRDCLKDGARKIIWSMYQNKHIPSKPRIKSQSAVGEVMKYSVHGDASILGTMMRLTQPYALRYPLIEKEGNTGSIIGGDDFAAPRYTEVRLNSIAMEMLKNIDKEVVTFKENYDQTKIMPTVLPSYFPNFVNGSTGIGVGAATSIPQFNINEVCEALKAMITKDNLTFDDVYCPIDFATGATIVNEIEVKESLKNGTGASAKMRATIEYDENKNQLIVTDLPYQVFTNTICTQLAEHMNSGDITQVETFFDGTDYNGVNIAINLIKKANIKQALDELYKFTSLQTHFSINMIMLENGKTPAVFGWGKLLRTYLNHLKDMISKSHKFDYDRIQEKIHIHEGYLIALEHIDEIISLIKASESVAKASQSLIAKYNFSEVQAKAILDLKLQRLTKLETIEIQNKLDNFRVEADYHKEIFSNTDRLNEVTLEEIGLIQARYGDKRRTKNMNISMEDGNLQIEEKNIIAYISNKGAIVAREVDSLLVQRRGTLGAKIKFTNKSDFIWRTIIGKNTEQVIVFSNKGKSFTLPLINIPLNEEIYFNQLLEFEEGEYITNVLSYENAKNYKYVVFATKNGTVKKTLLSEYLGSARKAGLIALKIKEGDTLVSTQLVENESDNILLTAKNGNCILIEQSDISATGRNTMGVKGINLTGGDELVSMNIISKDTKEILVITKRGYGKKIDINDFTLCSRATKGNAITKFKEDNDYIAGIESIDNESVVIVNSKLSSLKVDLSTVPTQSRIATGVSIIKVSDSNLVKNISVLEN